MSLCAQAKILRVVENREVCRVGSNRGVQPRHPIRCRYEPGSGSDDPTGTFRKDLFFRLNVVRDPSAAAARTAGRYSFPFAPLLRRMGSESSSSDPEFSEDSLRCLKIIRLAGEFSRTEELRGEFIFERSAAENRNRASAASHRGTHESKADLPQPERESPAGGFIFRQVEQKRGGKEIALVTHDSLSQDRKTSNPWHASALVQSKLVDQTNRFKNELESC